MTAELSRLISVTKIGQSGLSLVVEATPAECAAVAKRMDLPGIQALKCIFAVTRDEDEEGVIVGMGHLHARVTRICVVSAEEFETAVEDHFELRFVPAGEESDELDPDREDEIPYEGDILDLGDATAEQLGLILDPYPKMEGAVMPEVEGDDDRSPFSVLRRKADGEKPRK